MSQISDRRAEVTKQLQEVVEQHNQALEVVNASKTKFAQLQGALEELNNLEPPTEEETSTTEES